MNLSFSALLGHDAFLALPHALHWDAQQLADAVPQRLFELVPFDPAQATRSANRGHAPRRASYLPAAGLPRFRVRG